MRPRDRQAFLLAARQTNCWILVRHTNPESLRYVGMAGYIPKPIECKAKTSDNPNFRWVGLVANPNLVPQGYLPEKLGRAKEFWTKFENVTLKNPNWKFISDKTDPHFGCVTYCGSFIHGDYDLKDVIIADQMHRNLASIETLNGVPHMRGPRFLEVQRIVNGLIGSNMVQHGGEAQFADHVDEPIDAFSPDGQFKTFLNRAAMVNWYKRHNREVIDTSKCPPSQNSVGYKPWTPTVIKGGKSG